MAFHDVKLPDDIERGAQGGPRFKTTILALSSGFERRNEDWEQTRAEWDVGYGLRKKSQFVATIDFFYTRRGRLHTWRFKDWTDFDMAQQVIGVTDGANANFQIFKRYSSGGFDFDRTLTKITTDSEVVIVNSVTIAEGGGAGQYTLDDATGLVVLGSTLAAQSGTDVEVSCEFESHVRFDTDALDIIADTDDAATIPQIPVIEVRG